LLQGFEAFQHVAQQQSIAYRHRGPRHVTAATFASSRVLSAAASTRNRSRPRTKRPRPLLGKSRARARKARAGHSTTWHQSLANAAVALYVPAIATFAMLAKSA
jgi:hypothetical protein